MNRWNNLKCAVDDCPNTADPRWMAHDPTTGGAVFICDGHEGTPCTTTIAENCTCPTRPRGTRDEGDEITSQSGSVP